MRVFRRRLHRGVALHPFVVVLPLVLPLIGAFAACLSAPAGETPSSDGARSDSSNDPCDDVVRIPEQLELVTLDASGDVRSRQPCATTLCAFGSPAALAVRRADGLVDLTIGTHHVTTSPVDLATGASSWVAAADDAPGVLLGRRSALISLADRIDIYDSQSPTVRAVPIPPVAPGEHIGSFLRIDGHYGLTIVGAGASPKHRPFNRVVWLTDEPKGLEHVPSTGQPVSAKGVLRGYLEGVGESTTWTTLPESKRTELPFNRGVVATAVIDGDTVCIIGEQLLYVLVGDRPPALYPVAATTTVVATRGRIFVADDTGIAELTPAGERELLDADPTEDLLGNALPPGAHRARIRFGADDSGKLLIIERIRRAQCGDEDRLHLVDVVSGERRTLARDDKVRLRPMWAAGAFRYVEGAPRYRPVVVKDGPS